ncbi:Nn.00g037440.m01.CDS01 [Neocucurbitaria sp. VM-36]
MTGSQSLVLSRPIPSSTLATRSSSSSLIPSNFFTQQTGTAIATELLYRILFDILNRLLSSFQHLASKGFEECSSFIEQKLQERRDRLEAAKSSAAEGLKIVQEVGKLAGERGFITCPMTGRPMNAAPRGKNGVPGPPWARGVLEGIDEGRMHERDFWIQTHEG